jgi:hypothetical protein
MKTILKRTSIVLAGVGLLSIATSCDDFLFTPPVDRLSPETFYNTATQSNQGVVGIYAKLRNASNDTYWYLSECRSDNVWVNPRADGAREYSEIGTFRAAADVGTMNNAWKQWYEVIYNANVALTKIPEAEFVNETFRDQLLGEARFLRGWAYFELIRLFGNVPLVDAPLSPTEVNNLPLSPARDIYDRIIIPDLTEAVTKLPYKKDLKNDVGTSIESSGRADKLAAQAMLARVYMTMAGFPLNDASTKALAKTTLSTVIEYAKANGYLIPNITEWRKQWMPDYNNKYSIFAIQYRAGATGNPSIFNMSPEFPDSYTTIRIFGNQIYVEKSLAYEFEKNNHQDQRGFGYTTFEGYTAEEANAGTPGYTNTRDEVTIPGVGTVPVYENTMFYKFLPTKQKLAALDMTLNESTMSSYDQWPVNFPILRLEDMQLLYAEILAGEGDATGALAIVNELRARAGADPASGDAMAAIKRERRIELLGEGVRWHDLVRWNEWKQAIVDMFDRYDNPAGTDVNNVKDGRYLYPIPRNQMNINPGLYKQNDGY